MRHFESLAASSLLAASLFAGGCSAEQKPPEPSPTATTMDMPSADCPPMTALGEKVAKSSAQDCLNVMEAGKVALVGIGLSKNTLDTIAKDTENILHEASKGLIKITVTPVQASENAGKELDVVSPNCIDKNDPATWASNAAYKTDPGQLDQYDYVIGASSRPACNDIAGVTSQGTKLIDIFKVADTQPQPFVVIEKDGLTYTQGAVHPSVVAAHELTHGLGIGHTNSHVIDGATRNVINDANRSPSSIKSIDLLAHLKRGQLEEYGDSSNLQGSWEPDTTKKGWLDYAPDAFNPIQRAWLKEPRVILDKTEDPFVTIGAKPTKLKADYLYQVALPVSLGVDDFKDGAFSSASDYGQAVDYDKLVVVPGVETGTDQVSGVLDLYLTGSGDNTLKVDSIYGGTHWKLKLGKRTLTVTLGGDTPTLQFK